VCRQSLLFNESGVPPISGPRGPPNRFRGDWACAAIIARNLEANMSARQFRIDFSEMKIVKISEGFARQRNITTSVNTAGTAPPEVHKAINELLENSGQREKPADFKGYSELALYSQALSKFELFVRWFPNRAEYCAFRDKLHTLLEQVGNKSELPVISCSGVHGENSGG